MESIVKMRISGSFPCPIETGSLGGGLGMNIGNKLIKYSHAYSSWRIVALEVWVFLALGGLE